MAEYNPSKTQLRALEENGYTLEQVAVEAQKDVKVKMYGGVNMARTITAEKVDFNMVKSFLYNKGIKVNGRNWKKIEFPTGNERVDMY